MLSLGLGAAPAFGGAGADQIALDIGQVAEYRVGGRFTGLCTDKKSKFDLVIAASTDICSGAGWRIMWQAPLSPHQ